MKLKIYLILSITLFVVCLFFGILMAIANRTIGFACQTAIDYSLLSLCSLFFAGISAGFWAMRNGEYIYAKVNPR